MDGPLVTHGREPVLQQGGVLGLKSFYNLRRDPFNSSFWEMGTSTWRGFWSRNCAPNCGRCSLIMLCMQFLNFIQYGCCNGLKWSALKARTRSELPRCVREVENTCVAINVYRDGSFEFVHCQRGRPAEYKLWLAVSVGDVIAPSRCCQRLTNWTCPHWVNRFWAEEWVFWCVCHVFHWTCSPHGERHGSEGWECSTCACLRPPSSGFTNGGACKNIKTRNSQTQKFTIGKIENDCKKFFP